MIDLRFGDALELMKQIPDNSIDCVVTDCPYRIVAGGVSLKREDSPSGCLNRKYVSDGTRCSNKWIKKDKASGLITPLVSELKDDLQV